MRRRLGAGFETLEIRTPPASLLGAFADIFGQEDDNLFTDLQRSNSGGETERDAVAEDHARAPDISKIDVEPIDNSDNDSPVVSSKVSKEPVLAAKAGDTQDVFELGNRANVLGESTLARNPNGVSVLLKTTDLTPGNVYTMWFVIFNNPAGCEGPCNGPDVIGATGEDVNGTLAYGAGSIARADGGATFAASLNEGDTSGYPTDFPIQPLPGAEAGLVDADTGEVHLVIRDHGAKLPGLVSEQLHTFSGGCDVNVCDDVQGAVHIA